MPSSGRAPRLAVVIPCYRVRAHILSVIARIGPEVERIFVVDDACPEGSGALVAEAARDSRVDVIFHQRNQGVGGATVTGYLKALESGAEVIVKLDGDGQMDPVLIPALVAPILEGHADYTKGNRFHNVEDTRTMPFARLIGNALLSFLSKLSTGYWHIFDPTNGFTAIHAAVLRQLPLSKLSRRFFFESDVLFRLNTVRAKVLDIPMPASYGSETSNLSIWKSIPEFFIKHMINMSKRIIYNYFLRDFSLASLEIVFGLLLFFFGVGFGAVAWRTSLETGEPATAGTVMLATLPILMGLQLILAFLAYDIANEPDQALYPLIQRLFQARERIERGLLQ